MPLVSVIIPCYNAKNHVAEAIESALGQTHSNCEVIVIDDGSTDGSLDVIKRFVDRIRWATGPNRGGCAARNSGLQLAKGEYIQFLDADDRMNADKIEVQLAALENAPPGSIACCPWRYFDERGVKPTAARRFWRSYPRGIDLLVDMWEDGGFFSPSCWLVPRALLTSIGGWNEQLFCDQDGEYFGRVLLECREVLFVDSTCCWYRTPAPSNVSRGVSRKALRSKAEAIKVVSVGLLERCSSPKAVAALRKRWIGLAVFCSEHCKESMDEALSNLNALPAPPGHPDNLRGSFLRSLAAVFGISAAIKIRSRLKCTK
jgi:glycosyltransferase involved in cell wall biosynthesis